MKTGCEPTGEAGPAAATFVVEEEHIAENMDSAVDPEAAGSRDSAEEPAA